MDITVLSGPTGTELIRRGVDRSGPEWSAHAVTDAPHVLDRIHREYAEAGANVLVACTFRTQPRLFPGRFAELTRQAVGIARSAAEHGQLVAGSLAPIADCFRPLESPLAEGITGAGDAEHLHTEMARALVDAGADIILCETFPRTDEALIAARAALRVAGSIPVWFSLTPGPDGTLLSPAHVEIAAHEAAQAGVRAVLVNCVGAKLALPYVHALARAAAATHTPFGIYANAGDPADALGWNDAASDAAAARRYADLAATWIEAGASIIGSCCGTGPVHTRELATRFAATKPTEVDHARA